MITRPLLTLLAAVTVTGGFALAPSGAAPVSAPPSIAAAMPLGDLSSYRTITADTLALVDKGDIPAAQKRVTDLETAWDKAEDGMKPMDPTRWRVVDKAIDRALGKLRAGTPKPADCAAALKNLLGTIDNGGTA